MDNKIMNDFMKPPELEVLHNHGDNTFGFHCINIISEHDYQTDTRLSIFPMVFKTTYIRNKSIDIGFSIMNKIGLSTKFTFGTNSYEIWRV